MRRLLSLVLPLALCSGCFLVASTDGFVEDEGCDLELDVRAFAPHLGQTFQVRLVQDPPESIGESRPRLLALAIFDPLQHPNLDLQLPNAVPALTDPTQPRPYIDFYADFNGDGVYSSPPADHTWRVEDPCEPGRDPAFLHNLEFFDLPLPIGGGSSLFVDFCPNLTTDTRFDRLEPFTGMEPVEVRVTGTFFPTGEGMTEVVRPVGYYRLEPMGSFPGNIEIPAVFDSGFRYKIEVIVDRDGDFAYGAASDQGWVYEFNPETAPRCPDLTDMATCGLSSDTVNRAPACLDERNNIRVRLSRAHIANFGPPTEARWIEVPEGT